MEASFFRGFGSLNGLRPPQAARETRANDRGRTSEVHASTRSTARCVAARGEAAPVARVYRRLRIAKSCISYPVPASVPASPCRRRRRARRAPLTASKLRKFMLPRGRRLGVWRRGAERFGSRKSGADYGSRDRAFCILSPNPVMRSLKTWVRRRASFHALH